MMSKRRKIQPASHTPQDQQQPEQAEQPHAPEISWIELATDTEPWCAIPVLPRYQADLPNWTDNRKVPDSEKWLGQQIWPLQESEETSNGSTQDKNKEVIGKGRPEICSCHSPGSVECVNRHVTEERNKLKTELGPAFEEWKFDEIGEEISNAWSSREQKRFEGLVKRNLSSEDISLVESAWKSFRGKDRKSLVRYYFDVYIPRRICKQTRSGGTEVETDEDVASESHEMLESEKPEPNNGSQKKGTKSETEDDEAGKSRKPRLIESQKSSAKHTGNNKYLSGRR